MLYVIELWGGIEDGRLIQITKKQLGLDYLIPISPPLSLLREEPSIVSIQIEHYRYVRTGKIHKGRHIYRYKGVM